MNLNERETIKKAFLSNVGKVIRRNRLRRGFSQEALGYSVGVSHSAIDRYENTGADITAGMMAYISVELGFPMKEYVETREDALEPGVPIDEMFFELLRAIEADRISKNPSKKRSAKKVWRFTESEAPFFISYIMQESMLPKRRLVEASYSALYSNTQADPELSGTLLSLIRAVVRFVCDDEDRKTKRRLGRYARQCREDIGMQMNQYAYQG